MSKTPPQVPLGSSEQSPPSYSCIAVSPSGPFLAAGSEAGIVSLWDYKTGALLSTYQPETPVAPIWAIAMSHKGLKITTGGDSHQGVTAIFQDGPSESTAMQGPQPNIRDIAWSADDRLIATSSHDGSVCLWDARSGPVRNWLRLLKAPGVQDMEVFMFSPDSTRIITSYELPANIPGALVVLWDTMSGQVMTRLDGHQDKVMAVAFAPDGRIATGSMDGTCKIWSAEGKLICTLPPKCPTPRGIYLGSVMFSPDGKDIAIGKSNGLLDIWDSRSGVHLNQFGDGSHSIVSTAYSHTGRLVAVGCQSGITAVWNTVSKKLLVEIVDEVGDNVNELSVNVKKVVFALDDAHLITESHSGLVRVWGLQSMRKAQVKPHVLGMASVGPGRVARRASTVLSQHRCSSNFKFDHVELE